MVTDVEISTKAQKQLRKLPSHIRRQFAAWVESIEEDGLEVTRRAPGLHDEPLRGKLRGLRSVRLSKSYRAYYRLVEREVKVVFVERVDKHEY